MPERRKYLIFSFSRSPPSKIQWSVDKVCCLLVLKIKNMEKDVNSGIAGIHFINNSSKFYKCKNKTKKDVYTDLLRKIFIFFFFFFLKSYSLSLYNIPDFNNWVLLREKVLMMQVHRGLHVQPNSTRLSFFPAFEARTKSRDELKQKNNIALHHMWVLLEKELQMKY